MKEIFISVERIVPVIDKIGSYGNNGIGAVAFLALREGFR